MPELKRGHSFMVAQVSGLSFQASRPKLEGNVQ